MARGFKEVPAVTGQEMKRIDDELMSRYGIDLLVMMENAGRSLAILAKRILRNSVERRRIACLIGKGNNGGGGLVAARHLHNWGASVECILAVPTHEMKDVPARQLKVLENTHVKVQRWKSSMNLKHNDLLVDALIGYNLRGDPKRPFDEMILASNRSGITVLALDLPSGLDATTGKPYNPCMVAQSTLTLMLPKTGLLERSARRFVGRLYLADISAPRELYEEYGVKTSLFAKSSIVRLY